MRMFCSNMSFSYTNFKADIAKMFTVTHISKKDMMSKTEGPPMRVSALKISRHTHTLEDAILQPVPVVAS